MEDSLATPRPYLFNRCICLDKAGFEIVRNSILKHLLAFGAMTTDKLGLLVEKHLKSKFDEPLYRYYETVRQILETRGEIRHVPNSPILIEIAG